MSKATTGTTAWAGHNLKSRQTDPETTGPALVPERESQLGERFFERVRMFAWHRLRERSAAEDVAQETLRRVIEALRGGHVADLGALSGFVFSVALNVCRQRHRSAGREAKALDRMGAGAPRDEEPGGAEATPLDRLVTEERRLEVRKALESLDQEDRELLRQFFDEGLGAGEVAQRQGLTANAVRVRKHRALNRLAARLRNSDAGNDPAGSGT